MDVWRGSGPSGGLQERLWAFFPVVTVGDLRMVWAKGFEPLTSGTQSRGSAWLNYAQWRWWTLRVVHAGMGMAWSFGVRVASNWFLRVMGASGLVRWTVTEMRSWVSSR